MASEISQQHGNILNTSKSDVPVASKDVKRHCNASDVQDILPVSASTGNETTGYRKKRRRKPGPKRKNWMPNPYGRYPGSSALKHYQKQTDQTLAPSTRIERSRKIRRILKDFLKLGIPTKPDKIKPEHIHIYLRHLEKKGLENSTIQKYLMYLRDFLDFYDNTVIHLMLAKKTLKMPVRPPKELICLTEEEVLEIQRATCIMQGWKGSVARFITVFYPTTGLRPSELRTLRYSDLNIDEWYVIVSHPKGEKSYGKKRITGIPDIARESVIDFLHERRNYLSKHGKPETFEHLIPYETQKKTLSVWPEAKWRALKSVIEKSAGVKFRLKDFRSTFCQRAIDNGASLSAVSKVMGHSTTATTEKFYGRIRDKTAINEVMIALSKPRATEKI